MYAYLCVGMSTWVEVPAEARYCISLELEYRWVVSCLMWVHYLFFTAEPCLQPETILAFFKDQVSWVSGWPEPCPLAENDLEARSHCLCFPLSQPRTTQLLTTVLWLCSRTLVLSSLLLRSVCCPLPPFLLPSPVSHNIPSPLSQSAFLDFIFRWRHSSFRGSTYVHKPT